MLFLVLEALKSLTARVNLSTGLSHYSDESSAKEIFKLLYKEGEHLLASEITMWAIDNQWKTKDAQQLGELAEKIGRGGRVVVRNKNQWRADIIAQLKTRAGNTKT
jgi:hypothetical protein